MIQDYVDHFAGVGNEYGKTVRDEQFVIKLRPSFLVTKHGPSQKLQQHHLFVESCSSPSETDACVLDTAFRTSNAPRPLHELRTRLLKEDPVTKVPKKRKLHAVLTPGSEPRRVQTS